MTMWTSRERCLLCGYIVDASEVSRHRRNVHEIMPDERTVIDVPEGRPNGLTMTPATAQHEQHLVESVAT